MKHEGCGGMLKKYGKKPGRYRCVICRVVIKLGAAGPFANSYIKSQARK